MSTDTAADLSAVSSVASFFISRVDSEVDRRLDTAGNTELQGTAALTQGRLAYAQFVQAFSGSRWEALAARGARVQRPLWASTGTKNPSYSDVLYVDGLIGPDTVNTLPEPTLDAFIDHGAVARTVDVEPQRNRAIWAALAEAGIDMSDVAHQLELDGLSSFAASFDEVIAANWLAVMGIFNFIGTLASGWLTDRIDPRRLLFFYYSFRGVSLFLLPAVHDNLSIGLFAVLFGLDYIATVPPTIMLCAEAFGRNNAGAVYGWVFAAHQIGAAAAAWGAGLIRDDLGGYGWAFSAGGGIAIAAGMMATMIRRPGARRTLALL